MSVRKKTINGALRDVAGESAFTGYPERAIRAMVARRQIPFRKNGGRIVFVHREIEEWIDSLPGVSLSEIRKRQAES